MNNVKQVPVSPTWVPKLQFIVVIIIFIFIIVGITPIGNEQMLIDSLKTSGLLLFLLICLFLLFRKPKTETLNSTPVG